MSPIDAPIAVGRTAEIFAWGDHCILKLIRPGFPSILADQEWQHSQLAWQLKAPTLPPVELLEVEGRRGVVFQRITGPTLTQAIQAAPLRIAGYGKLLGRLHVEVNRIQTLQFPSQAERMERNLKRSIYIPTELKAGLLTLLARMPAGHALCHADFHPENILLSASGPLLIDWEGSLHGHPGGDVANTCLWIYSALFWDKGISGWFKRLLGRVFLSAYLDEYRRLAPANLENMESWLAIQAALRMNEYSQAQFGQLLSFIQRGLGKSLV